LVVIDLNMWSIWVICQITSTIYYWNQRTAFYKWFLDKSVFHKKDLSTNVYPLFGIVKMPLLSYNAFCVVSQLYIFTMFMSIFLTDDFFINKITFILYVLYASSLWAEETLAYHRDVFPCIMHLYYTFSPNCSSFIQYNLASIYCIAGLQKIIFSCIQETNWSSYTLLSLIWNARLSRMKYPTFQKLLILYPKLCLIFGYIALFAEISLLPFLYIFGNNSLYTMLIVLILSGMHINIKILQGIDYCSTWIPVLICSFLTNSYEDDAEIRNCLWFMTSIQFIFTFLCLETSNINMLPLTSTPMFIVIKTVFGEDVRSFNIGKCVNRHTRWETLEWSYPYVHVDTEIGLYQNILERLPFEYVLFGRHQINPGGILVGASKLINGLVKNKWVIDQTPKYYCRCNFYLPKHLKSDIIDLLTNLDNYSKEIQWNTPMLSEFCDKQDEIVNRVNDLFG